MVAFTNSTLDKLKTVRLLSHPEPRCHRQNSEKSMLSTDAVDYKPNPSVDLARLARLPSRSNSGISKQSPLPIIKGPRIPLALQAVFLASNRGDQVDLVPNNGVAFKVFEKTPTLDESKRTKKGASGARSIIFGSDETFKFDNQKPPSAREGKHAFFSRWNSIQGASAPPRLPSRNLCSPTPSKPTIYSIKKDPPQMGSFVSMRTRSPSKSNSVSHAGVREARYTQSTIFVID